VREKRGARPKSPRWSAERRASPRDARRLARRLACRVKARPAGAPSTGALSRRSATPHSGCAKQKAKPGRKNAPRERERLCEMVQVGISVAANSVCSLPRSRGRVGERASKRESSRVPLPYPSPASGGGNTPSARQKQRRWALRRREGLFGIASCVFYALVLMLRSVRARSCRRSKQACTRLQG
jgi:hypothetical protein